MGRLRDSIEESQTWLQERLLAAANPVFFRLRRSIGFRRRGYAESPAEGPAPHPSMRAWLDGPAARELIRAHALEPLVEKLSRESFAAVCRFTSLLRETLDATDIDAIRPNEDGSLPALDIGAKNFEVAPAIHAVLTRLSGSPVAPTLTGIEIDAYRVYRSLHSRHDAACYYLSLLPGGLARHRFVAGDLLHHEGRYRFISWSKPFLDSYPLLRFGLPTRLLRPEEMLRHALSLLDDDGICVILNQNQMESDQQRALLDRLGAGYRSCEPHDPAGGAEGRAFAHVVRKA